jgi:hypothetical protein
MYPRDPRDLCSAVTEIIEAIGFHEVCKAVNLAKSTVEKWACPTVPAKPNLEQCIALDAAYERITNERGLIISLYAERLSHQSMTDQTNAPELDDAALDLGIATGKVIEVIKHITHEDSDSGADITPREEIHAMKFVAMLRRAATRMEDAIKVRSVKALKVELS